MQPQVRGRPSGASVLLKVVTTVAPITSIAANIGGDWVSITGLVPEGTNSHTFEPPPSASVDLSQADVVFVNGLQLEEPTKELASETMAKASRAPGYRLAVRTAFWLVFVGLAGGVGTLAVWMLAGRPIAEGLILAITMVVLTCSDTSGSATPHAIGTGAGTDARRGVASGNATAMPASKEIDGINALTLTWLELPYAIPADPGLASAPRAARWSDQGISRRASRCI